MQNQNIQRKSIHLPKEQEAAVNRLLDLKNSKNPAGGISQMAERYLSIIKRSVPDFSTAEWCLIFDALKPPWSADEAHAARMAAEITEAMSSDRLDLKWPVDGTKFRNKINRLPYAGRMAVGEITEAFWCSESGGSYAEVINGILKEITGWEQAEPATARRERLSPERMGEPADPKDEPPDETGEPGEEAAEDPGEQEEEQSPAPEAGAAEPEPEPEETGAGTPPRNPYGNIMTREQGQRPLQERDPAQPALR